MIQHLGLLLRYVAAKYQKGMILLNECFVDGCTNKTSTEFCCVCLANGGVQTNPMIENNFKYHSPKNGQPEKYATIRQKAKELAYLIEQECPDGRERSIAFTNLETAVMWANASIARSDGY